MTARPGGGGNPPDARRVAQSMTTPEQRDRLTAMAAEIRASLTATGVLAPVDPALAALMTRTTERPDLPLTRLPEEHLMGSYGGSTEPVDAAEVAIGDLLVHDKADAGYLTVTDARNDGQVSLLFETGDTVTYPPDLRLYRVTPLAGPGQAWGDNDGRWHHRGCDGNRYCDTDPEDDGAPEGFDCLGDEEPCPVPHARPCWGCWSPPASTPAYIAAEHRAQIRLANAGRGLTRMVRLVERGTMPQASLDASRDEYEAARRAVAAVHSTPIGSDPLPGGLRWDALDVVAWRLYALAVHWTGLTGLCSWDAAGDITRDYWRGEALGLLAEAVKAGEA